jgi:hypothetical protein
MEQRRLLSHKDNKLKDFSLVPLRSQTVALRKSALLKLNTSNLKYRGYYHVICNVI